MSTMQDVGYSLSKVQVSATQNAVLITPKLSKIVSETFTLSARNL
jgi:hypothetical protein